MIKRTPKTTPFPYTTLFRSTYADQSLSTDIGSLVDAKDLENVRLLTWKFNIVPDNPTPQYTAFLDAMKAKGDIKDRKSTRLNSSHVEISYAVFCLQKKIDQN